MILNALLFTDVSILSLKCFLNLKNKAKLASTDASPMRNQLFIFFFLSSTQKRKNGAWTPPSFEFPFLNMLNL